jgi:Fic family protein
MSQDQNFGAFKWIEPPPPPKKQSDKPGEESMGEPKPINTGPSMAEVSHRPRGSISNLFGDPPMPGNGKQQQRKTLPQDLAKSLRTSWPNWGSISRATGAAPMQLNYTIRMSINYLELPDHIPDPQGLFDETCASMNEIRQNKRPEHEELLARDFKEGMMSVVFSSNNIERAGLNLQETIKICQRIFNGEDVKAEDISERSEEYNAAIQSLINSKIQKPGNANIQHVIRSRQEVIQHARALDYITRAIAIDNQPLSELLIRTTHQILVTGIDSPDTGHGRGIIAWQEYGGNYRKIPVITGTTCFVVPQHIPKKMKELVKKFNKDIEEAEQKEEIDPFHLAAKYSNMFVLIHPFLDGNGRTCRLILNAILLKYAGTVAAFGENDASREEYYTIVRRAAEDVRDNQSEFAAFILEKASLRLKGLRQKLMAELGQRASNQ